MTPISYSHGMVVRATVFAIPFVAVVLSGCAGFDLGKAMHGQGTGSTPVSSSPAAGSSASRNANDTADKVSYKPLEYANVTKKGPQIVVLPGAVKSSNPIFVQRIQPNNIADFAEVELTRANFTVVERSNLKAIEREFELAYNLGDPRAAQQILQHGKLKATRWIVGFDIIKAEPVATARTSVDGATVGRIFKAVSGDSKRGEKRGEVGDAAIGSVQSDTTAGVWLVGMRYRIIDANTTEQVGTGYQEQKMEIGATSTAVLGVRQEVKGAVTLDTLVQQLIQVAVSEMDTRYK